jgi:hypothetical protein
MDLLLMPLWTGYGPKIQSLQETKEIRKTNQTNQNKEPKQGTKK